MNVLDYLWPAPQNMRVLGKATCPIVALSIKGPAPLNFKEGIKELKVKISSKGTPVIFKKKASSKVIESYNILVKGSKIVVESADDKGMFYASQTLLQLISYSLSERTIPELKIEDKPAHKVRAFMVDLGRATFSLKYLKRIVRIMASLKMNALHVHLFDDQLFGIKLKGLPLGKENPGAITLSEFKELIVYAKKYYIEIIPEIEAWGHIGSIVYHYPKLKGGPGMYGSTSFLICEETIELIKNIVSQIVSVMPKEGMLHFGLDEANWYVSNEKSMADLNPTKLVGVLYRLLLEVNKKYKKDIKMCVWADHGGRPVPKDIQKHIIIEPWNYWIKNREQIEKSVKHYGGRGKPPVLLGGGISSEHFRGAYAATGLWSRKGAKYKNIMGVDVTFWEANDIPAKLLPLFTSFGFCWNPNPSGMPDLSDYENVDQLVGRKMIAWQLGFDEGRADLLYKDMGEHVYKGFYITGKRRGKPVAVTAALNRTGYFVE